jgi:exoribonuclease R
MQDWIPGTLELSAKVRYGIGSRGIPLFRFVPYDTSIGPFAVGCSQRDLFHNVHAIVTPNAANAANAANSEPSPQTNPSFRTLLPKGTLVQNLGIPNDETNLQVLLAAYAYDGKKSLRLPKVAQQLTIESPIDFSKRPHVEGITFHIDPPGCKDVDDSFSFLRLGRTSKSWRVSINIADVAAWVKEGSEHDTKASERATSFYSPEGEALVPMFPREISEGAASLRGSEPRPTFSLQFTWTPGAAEPLTDFQWVEAIATTHTSYTYDEADAAQAQGMNALKQLSAELDPTNVAQTSHEWVQNMMILYNRKAGETLRKKGNGILRRHSAPKAAALAQWTAIDPSLSFLAYEAATFCLATNEDTRHFGLSRPDIWTDAYAYASSPIRRYCDLVNQRILKGASAAVQQETVDALNRRQKQAKAFSRDLFFMRELALEAKVQEGLIVAHTEKSVNAVKAYIPAWKRCVKVKCLEEAEQLPAVGSRVTLEWLCDYQKPNWKEKIIFRINAQIE